MDSSKAGIWAKGQRAAEVAHANCWNPLGGFKKVFPQESKFTWGDDPRRCQSPSMAKKLSMQSRDPEGGVMGEGAAQHAAQKPKHCEERIPVRECRQCRVRAQAGLGECLCRRTSRHRMLAHS